MVVISPQRLSLKPIFGIKPPHLYKKNERLGHSFNVQFISIFPKNEIPVDSDVYEISLNAHLVYFFHIEHKKIKLWLTDKKSKL